MASAKAKGGQTGSFQWAMDLDGLKGVVGASGLKAAPGSGAKQKNLRRRKYPLIKPDGARKNGSEGRHALRSFERLKTHR